MSIPQMDWDDSGLYVMWCTLTDVCNTKLMDIYLPLHEDNLAVGHRFATSELRNITRASILWFGNSVMAHETKCKAT